MTVNGNMLILVEEQKDMGKQRQCSVNLKRFEPVLRNSIQCDKWDEKAIQRCHFSSIDNLTLILFKRGCLHKSEILIAEQIYSLHDTVSPLSSELIGLTTESHSIVLQKISLGNF
jgi:hypothetical protein